MNASTYYSPIRCRSDSSASWKSTICRTDLDIQTLMSKVSTIGWRKYSFMAAWRRLLRSTPWKHCWYLPPNRTLSYNSHFILIIIHIIVMCVFPVSLGDNLDILSWIQTNRKLKWEKKTTHEKLKYGNLPYSQCKVQIYEWDKTGKDTHIYKLVCWSHTFVISWSKWDAHYSNHWIIILICCA